MLARSHGYSSGSFTNHNFYHADGNGNITYMADASQNMVASYRYDPFGNTISSSGSLASANVYRFSSKERHRNSGMYYYGYRWYDPNLQRWLNRDPLGERGGLDLYTFVGNDPLNRYDPDGEIWPGPVIGAILCLAALAAVIWEEIEYEMHPPPYVPPWPTPPPPTNAPPPQPHEDLPPIEPPGPPMRPAPPWDQPPDQNREPPQRPPPPPIRRAPVWPPPPARRAWVPVGKGNGLDELLLVERRLNQTVVLQKESGLWLS